MRAVDEDIRAAALSAGRHIAVAVEIAAKSDGGYVTKQTLQSEVEYIKITVGGDSDGAAIGKTYCAKLVLKIPRYIDIAETDRLIVRVGYDTGAETSTGKMPLGWFYVDNIAINGYVATVTAFDKMLRGSKNYISTLDYPAVLPNVLDEVCAKMGLSLDSSVTVPNYTINTPPIRGKDKDGNTLYYSRRQMLGFIGSLMGGNWYIDAGHHLAIAKLADAVDTVLAANVFDSDINADVFTVTGISWNTGNQTYKRQDVDARGVIEFYNPLDVAHENIMAALEMALVGKSYYGGKIKRQGAGWHEIYDVVNAPVDKNGNTKPILLTGIERVFENGGYTETWQSCAQTESEANYTVDSGVDVSGTSEAEYPPLSEYEYLTDLSVRYNGVTYTAEKDDTTGLISRIYDDSGNEFKPTINSGITDITMHNAAFLAVAMCSGFGKKNYGNTNIFELSNAVNGMWKNSGDGYDIVFSDKTEITSECVKINDYIRIPITGDLYNYTSFIVVRKSENITDNDWHVALGQNPEFTPRIDICIYNKTWWIGGGTAGGSFASSVSANNDNYFVLAVRKTDMTGEFFINNNYIGKNNVFVTPINGYWFVDTGCFWFKHIETVPYAMADTEMTAKISKLMTTYGI